MQVLLPVLALLGYHLSDLSEYLHKLREVCTLVLYTLQAIKRIICSTCWQAIQHRSSSAF